MQPLAARTKERPMIELVFVACLAATPTTCEERRMQYVNVSLMECMMGAQPQLAQWSETHPGWRVGRWQCRFPQITKKA